MNERTNERVHRHLLFAFIFDNVPSVEIRVSPLHIKLKHKNNDIKHTHTYGCDEKKATTKSNVEKRMCEICVCIAIFVCFMQLNEKETFDVHEINVSDI